MLLDVMLAVCAPSSQGVKSCNLGERPHAAEPFFCSTFGMQSRVHPASCLGTHRPGHAAPWFSFSRLSTLCTLCRGKTPLPGKGQPFLLAWERGFSNFAIFVSEELCVFCFMILSLSLSFSPSVSQTRVEGMCWSPVGGIGRLLLQAQKSEGYLGT